MRVSKNISALMFSQHTFKKYLFGSKEKIGKINLLVYFAILGGIGFLFLYPVLYMIINSFKTPEDLVDPAIAWVPTSIFFGNYVKAFVTMDFMNTFRNSLLMSITPAIVQTIATAIIGYGLARFEFPFKKLWVIFIVATFIIPAQVTLIPRYMMFNNYGMINTPWPNLLPAAVGQGLKSAIFILIFYQFFSSYPKSLDEAAELDGAGKFRVFSTIAIPMAKPAIVVSMLFSFVWYWNETSQSSLFFGSVIKTLPMKLGSFAAAYEQVYNPNDADVFSAINESISLTGTFLSILPLLILYFILQRQFVESVERSGITGE
ncbi:MAG: transporter permease [Lachnospiraceae bacterium]|nr:transporter permease [Lachnospiraceae bacterium]